MGILPHYTTIPGLDIIGWTESLGSQMFAGYEPTPKGITLMRDLSLGTINFADFVEKVKMGEYK
jgi:hypothetical protein